MSRKPPSLKWRLILQPLVFHLLALLVAFSVMLALLMRADSGGHFAIETFAKVAAGAVVRADDGTLSVRMTPELAEAVEVAPAAWFVAEDEDGRHVAFGRVPPQFDSLRGHMRELTWGEFRGRTAENGMSAVLRQATGPAGKFTVLGHGELSTLTWRVALATNVLAIPIFVLLALVTLVLTPLIVNRTLAGVTRIAGEARRIDANKRGARLTEGDVPVEIAPLVRAVNDALARLDDGYETQRRFIAAAAHELRTPIAILNLKVEAAGDDTARRLSGEVARLATLAEQLLDLHRLDTDGPMAPVDLAALVRRVAADLAPILIAADKAIEVVVEPGPPVQGDAGALERVVTNLVQNAAGHGGRRVVVRAYERSLEVEDDGPGIPAEARERVFEPFQRLRPRQTGAGLGLNLVQQVVERHGGRITILDAPGGGALVRVDFPAP